MTTQSAPTIPLPKAWNSHVKSAVLHVISLAQYATCYTRGWAADSCNPRVHQQANVDRLNQEVVLLQDQLRIITLRLKSIPARSRPQYKPTERMAILELKAARGWSLDRKRCQEPLFCFFGLPWGRSVLSRPSCLTIFSDHAESP